MGGDQDRQAGRVANVVIFNLNGALSVTGTRETEVPRRFLLEAAKAALEELHARNPQSADYARDLSVSYERLGDLHRGLGNGAKAPGVLRKGPGDERRAARAKTPRAPITPATSR